MRYPKIKLNEENKELWKEEFKELNRNIINNDPLFCKNDFWLDVIIQYHIEKS